VTDPPVDHAVVPIVKGFGMEAFLEPKSLLGLRAA
jgi:hypothetical protein